LKPPSISYLCKVFCLFYSDGLGIELFFVYLSFNFASANVSMFIDFSKKMLDFFQFKMPFMRFNSACVKDKLSNAFKLSFI